MCDLAGLFVRPVCDLPKEGLVEWDPMVTWKNQGEESEQHVSTCQQYFRF